MSEEVSRPKRSPRGRPPEVLTERQQAIMDCIAESIKRRGYAPSMREIADSVNLVSASSVKHHLLTLERMGCLRRDPLLPRAIELVDTNADVPPNLRHLEEENQAKPRFVPLVGRIATGTPILAEHLVEGLYPLPREIVGDGEIFMLKVRGDSMIEAGINDGDYVVVRHQVTAENGQIVAALVEDEATVKVWQSASGKVQLLPRNPAYEPIPGRHAQILGRVVALIRSL
ncbi:MAG: transcriptional repressor LexA [Micrococcales bacterium]|nr:transcriptional repressor LexA [Micrococcales bacterium]